MDKIWILCVCVKGVVCGGEKHIGMKTLYFMGVHFVQPSPPKKEIQNTNKPLACWRIPTRWRWGRSDICNLWNKHNQLKTKTRVNIGFCVNFGCSLLEMKK